MGGWNSCLWLSDPAKGFGREAEHLRLYVLVIPIAQQKIELAVVVEWLLFTVCHVHYQRPVQPRCPLHSMVPVIEERAGLYIYIYSNNNNNNKQQCTKKKERSTTDKNSSKVSQIYYHFFRKFT